MADIFGGPTMEDLKHLYESTYTYRGPSPQRDYLAAWQCPGCGTFYAYFVRSCACQKRDTSVADNKIRLDSEATYE